MGLSQQHNTSDAAALQSVAFDKSDFYLLFKTRRTMSEEAAAAAGSSSSTMNINVTALRQALRLIHCLQKERGASCSYHASKSLFNKRLTVEPARRDTDRALRKASMCMNSHNARAVLDKIRKATESEGVSYHRILATYNCLISAIVHDGIWKHTNQRGNGKNNIGEDSTVKHDNVPTRRRVPSYSDAREWFGGEAPQKIAKPVHRRLQSEGFQKSSDMNNPMDFNFVMDKEDFQAVFANNNNNNNGGNDSGDMPKKPLPRIDSVGSDPSDEPETETTGDVSADDNSSVDAAEVTNNLPGLLNLLETFVALTESIGVERATLCSILAAGPESHHLLNVSIVETSLVSSV